MLPALRFFRHTDGTLAQFNGAGASDVQLLASLTRFDETLGEPLSHARHSGYHRLSAGGTVVIADTGTPPPLAVSQNAHAGTLAFELSSENARIVVNCGCPQPGQPELKRLARSTAAHSTLVLDERSSSRFAGQPGLDRFLGSPLVPGPTEVSVEEVETAETGRAVGFFASHNGYERELGFLHARRLELSPDGYRLDGEDRLIAPRRTRGRADAQAADLRFHLHPGVTVETLGRFARLSLRGQIWRFSADQNFSVDDSIQFAETSGPRRTLQLVITFVPGPVTTVRWAFERLS
nr:heparinase II/III family protein [Jiella flava]